MHKRQQQKSQSARRAQKFLDAHAKSVGILNGTAARRQLDAAVVRVAQSAELQGVLTRQMRGEASRQRRLDRDLRETHVVPMVRIARARAARWSRASRRSPRGSRTSAEGASST